MRVSIALLIAALCVAAVGISRSVQAEAPVLATVTVGDGPIFIAVNPTTNKVYVSNTFGGDLTVIDGTSYSVVNTIPLDSIPFRIAVDAALNRMFVAAWDPVHGTGLVHVVDGADDTLLTSIDLGPSNGATGVALNPVSHLVYVTNDKDRVIIIDAITNAVVGEIFLGPRPIGIAVNSVTNRIFVGDNYGGHLWVLDGGTNALLATIPIGQSPGAVDVNPVTNRVYVANIGSANVSVIDALGNSVIATVPTCCEPQGISVNSLTNRYYVATAQCCKVLIFDGSTNALVDTATFGDRLYGIDVNPCTGNLYIGDLSGNTVRVVQEPVDPALPPLFALNCRSSRRCPQAGSGIPFDIAVPGCGKHRTPRHP